jgi:hypothetical protein
VVGLFFRSRAMMAIPAIQRALRAPPLPYLGIPLHPRPSQIGVGFREVIPDHPRLA